MDTAWHPILLPTNSFFLALGDAFKYNNMAIIALKYALLLQERSPNSFFGNNHTKMKIIICSLRALRM